MKTERGFTLIELLVVIAVIAILASVVMASLSNARVKSRNTKRSQDISQIIKALNLGLTASNSLPLTSQGACLSTSCGAPYNTGTYASNPTVEGFLLQHMPSKPIDPVGGNRQWSGYLYTVITSSYYPNCSTGCVMLRWQVEPQSGGGNVCAPGSVNTTQPDYVDCFSFVNP